jgi:hypothetical protein
MANSSRKRNLKQVIGIYYLILDSMILKEKCMLVRWVHMILIPYIKMV